MKGYREKLAEEESLMKERMKERPTEERNEVRENWLGG